MEDGCLTNKLRALLQDHKSRDPTASDRLTDHFAEELRNDEAPNEVFLEEVFQLMSEGLEQVCGCVTAEEKAQATPPRWADKRRA
jgi:hypothetical protein